MSEEDRFNEEEVREIFDRASRQVASGPPTARVGWTLSDLQQIGREVGLAPEEIAEAAHAVALRRSALPVETLLGMPLGVGREVMLPRPPSDEEWANLVSDLRRTFRAQGREQSSGDARQWSNGNLVVAVEPTREGHRLRLGTRKGDAAGINVFGVGAMSLGAVIGLGMLLTGEPAAQLLGPAVLMMGGGGALSVNAARLRRWAAVRQEQMEEIASRTLRMLGRGTP